MSRALRFALVGLVLTNLGFAYITEAANWSWLGPLLVLTLLAPWLARWSSLFVYRAAWNLSVLATFGLMIHHTSADGAAHLLEDGLMLAALCQVHLLNNLGSMQKPDLLFFNSFLIALVTSFLSVDVGYSIVFGCYASLLVLSLQLLVLERGDGSQAVRPSAAQSRRMLLAGAGRAGVVLALTLAVFFLAPRDFQRRGLLGDSVRLRPPGALAEVDFSKSVRLDRLGAVTASNRVVLRVYLKKGSRYQVPQHWRGAALDVFDGTRWYEAPDYSVLVRRRWQRGRGAGTWDRGSARATAHVIVERVSDVGDRLPMPLSARQLRVVPVSDYRNMSPASDLTFRTRRPAPRRYELDLAPEDTRPSLQPRLDMKVMTHTALLPRAVPAELRKLARQLRGSLPADAGPDAIVDRVRDHLATSFAYLPPGAEGGAGSLRGFLTTAKGGHCEYFASAMVVILRTLSIPCRLVTGYRSDEWDENRQVLTIRARHAHAWVEVLDSRRGWRTVDPTPPSDSPEALARLGSWTRLQYRLSMWWDKVMGFNASASKSMLAWFASIPSMVRERPAPAAVLALALVGLVFLLRRLRAPRLVPAVRDYAQALRRLGVELHPGETPRELLARSEFDDAQRGLLVAATLDHERARYSDSGERTSATSVTPGFGSS